MKTRSLSLFLFCFVVLFGCYVSYAEEAKTSSQNVRNIVESNVIDNTGRTAVFTLSSGETKRINDGQYALSSANGRVWHDLNGNANDDELDKQITALAGVPVYLHNDNGTIVETTHTRNDGKFTFKVDPGRYHISVDCPAGFTISPQMAAATSRIDPKTKKSESFHIEASRAVTGLDCGCYKPPSVTGTIFRDLNMDGIQTAGPEKGIPEIEVQLSMGSDSTFSRKAWTDEHGRYAFLDLVPGDYALTIITSEEYRHSPLSGIVNREKLAPTADGSKRVSVKSETLTRSSPKTRANNMKEVSIYFTLLSGDKAYVDQGLFTLSTVEGVVFEDINADGVWSNGEKILPNVEVTLLRTPQVVMGKTRSNELGEYKFPNLEPGEYYVSFDLSSPEYKHSASKKH